MTRRSPSQSLSAALPRCQRSSACRCHLSVRCRYWRQTQDRPAARSGCRRPEVHRHVAPGVLRARPRRTGSKACVAVARDERPLAVRGEDRQRRRARRLTEIDLPDGRDLLPAIAKTDTVPSLRFATSASVPAGLMDTPAGPRPACSVASTAGGVDFKSMTVTVSSAIVRSGLAGSIFVDAVTSAIDSSGATATLWAGSPSCPAR